MATVEVEVDLDEFSDKEIIQEVKDRVESDYRYKKNSQLKADFIKGLKELLHLPEIDVPKNMSLPDQMKLDFFMENFNKITEDDLRKIISK